MVHEGTTIGVSRDVLSGLKVVSIASCWTGVPVLDSGECGLERDPDRHLEPPGLVRRVILRLPQRPTSEEVREPLVIS